MELDGCEAVDGWYRIWKWLGSGIFAYWKVSVIVHVVSSSLMTHVTRASLQPFETMICIKAARPTFNNFSFIY